MMNDPLVRWLLNLQIIPPDAEGVRFGWEHPWPAWVWVALVMVASGVAFWSYARLLAPGRGRAILAGVRFALVVLILVLISGPVLKLPQETVEQDWLLVLLDRSASMRIADVQGPGGRLSRDEQMRTLLSEHAPMWRRLAEMKHVEWLGFHDGAFGLTPTPAPPGADDRPSQTLPVVLAEPAGGRTRLDAALAQALRRAAARAVSGIVLFTDGRTTDPPSRALVRRLRSEKVGVYTVGLGSTVPVGDLAIRRVEAPRRAFVRDQVPVVVELDQLVAGAGEHGAVVRLIDEASGVELDSLEVGAVGQGTVVTLTAEPVLAGEATWRVMVETDRPDLVQENNTVAFVIQLIDRPLRVLYVEGYPRWEYRYLKNLLVREKSIDSSVMLISADRDFAQEGNQPITRLPRSPEEFAPFDVIVVGDVPGTFFSPQQLEMIRHHVGQRGAGLLFIGGERYMPRTYAGTVLADLLPVRGSLALPPIGRPVTMIATALSDRLGLMRLSDDDQEGWPAELANPETGWSQLNYAQRIEPGRLKPTAEVLASTVAEFRGTRLPLVIHMRYGAGQIIYVATDEIWRWRYGRGERLPERFWVQIIRRLGRESLAGSADAARLEVQPRRATTGQAVQIELRLLDARLLDQTRLSVAAVIQTPQGRTVTELQLHRLDASDPVPYGAGAEPARFAATYVPGMSGPLRVRIDEPTLAGLKLAAELEVFAPDDELRRPETDHELLQTLAADSGGQMIPPDELGRLEELLPNRSVRTISPLTEPIWDTPLAFGLFLVLIGAEWVGRKMIRLA